MYILPKIEMYTGFNVKNAWANLSVRYVIRIHQDEACLELRSTFSTRILQLVKLKRLFR